MLRGRRYKKRHGVMRSLSCALAISGLDPSAGAGLFADLRAFRAASVWGCGAVAVVTVQSTVGLRSSAPVPTPLVLAQVRELWSHQNVRAIKIGALGSPANVRGIARWLGRLERKVPIVIDPVMRATRGLKSAALLEKAGWAAMLQMSKLAAVVTPNAPEAEALLGQRVRTLADAERAARAFVDLGARAALVKGGHLPRTGRSEMTDVLAVGDRVLHFRARRAKITPHGTGCTLASLIAGKLAGASRIDDEIIVSAIRWAKRQLTARLVHPVRIGTGQWVMP